MEKHVFNVRDMTCEGCVASIRSELQADPRIKTVSFKLSRKEVEVTGEVSAKESAEMIRNAGFHPEEGEGKKGLLGRLLSS